MDQVGTATNVIGMVGHGALREVVMGLNAPRPATDSEVAADITIFDLEKVRDNSLFVDPTIYADGFEHVMVNGVVAFSQGKRTPDHARKVLRKQ